VSTAQAERELVEPVVDRASARRFAETRIRPRANEFDRRRRVPEDLLGQLAAAGLWAPFLPAGDARPGVDMVTLGHIHEEIGRCCSSVRSFLTVHAMVAFTVHRWGSAAQQRRWLPALAGGTAIGAFCLTEPAVGSDATRIAAAAVPDGRRGWVLDGVKRWITAGQRADVFLVFARTESGIGAFLVPRAADGLTVRPIEDILGTRAGMLAEVTLHRVRVDPDALVGPSGFAAGAVLTAALDVGRYSVAAGSVGIIQACLDACVEYTASRTIGSTPLRDFQLIQAKIADMSVDAHAGRLLYEYAGRLKDGGDPATILATWRAKYFASVAAARHAAQAVQIHGANGCGSGYPVERYFRDAKVMEIIEGSTEVQQITIAAGACADGAP
jgi:alkylation response protein AidB-like acyl-CoA dehydrogenase